MRVIAIEAERANQQYPTGVEEVAKQVILSLSREDHQNTYILLLKTTPQEWLLRLPSNFHVKYIPFRFLWSQLRLSWEFLTNTYDVFYSFGTVTPLVHPRLVVATIHDMHFRAFPGSDSMFNRLYNELNFFRLQLIATHIVTPTLFSRNEIVKYFPTLEKRISVVPNGPPELQGATEQDFSLPTRSAFIVVVATLQPRKNISRFIRAYTKYRMQHKDDLHLVVIGKKGWMCEEIEQTIKSHSDFVHYIGYVNRFQKESIVSRSVAIAIPSLYEGFGLPVLEAFFLAKPLLCANNSCLPEVAGDAAVYFDPFQETEIIEAIKKIRNEPDEVQMMVKRGKLRLEQFSWKKYAQTIVTLFT